MSRLRAIFVVLASLATSTANAEPLVIGGAISSFVVFHDDVESFRFAGNGFEVASAGFFPRVFAPTCTFCREGDLLNLSWRTPGEVPLGSGSARFGSTTFSDVAYRGTLTFDVSALTFPATTNNVIGVRPPFSFTGSLRGFEGDQQVFAADFIGEGIAMASFISSDEREFVLDSNSPEIFAFTGGQAAPVPEPASVLLLGGAVASSILARQRRRNR